MDAIRSLPAALAALLILCAPAASAGRAGPPPSPIVAPDWRHGAPTIAAGAAWGAGTRTLDEAWRWIGVRNPTGFAGPWCKAFTNFVIERLGFHPGPSLMAIDALRDGQRVAVPQPGDLAVMRGHVTFFVRWIDAGRFIGLGGNQHHAVAELVFSRRAVVAFVRP